jgi:Ca-activated chloride channel family protein
VPAEFHFLRPDWLWAVPVVVALAIFFARRRLGAGSWQDVIHPSLAPYILSSSPSKKMDYRWWLLGFAGLIGVLSLAGPAWQRMEQPVFRSEQAIVVALDLSRSMDAQDVAPSRLLRARLKILDMLDRRQSGQTALIVYSSNAFTVTPLTTDNDTIASLVNSLGTDIMPSRGSYPVAAINKGRQLLEQAGARFGEVLLITDGGSSPAAERAARDLKSAGYTMSVLAVGTRTGAPIPKLGGGFVTDQSGNIAVPKLEESSLRRLAGAGGGRFAVLSADARDLDVLLSGEVGPGAASDESLATDHWREEGPWLLLLLLPLAALAFRRGWVLLIVVFVLPIAEPAQASLWDDLWRTKDQQAQRQLDEGNAAEAAELFENSGWRAVAHYEAEDFAEAAATFAESGDTQSLYNLGNAVARQGDFESAIDVYEQVLEMDPDDIDAAYNRDLVQQALEQQEQQQQQDGEQESSEQSEGEGEESESDSESDQESEDGSESESDSEQGDSQRDDQEASQEDLDAMLEELERAAQEAEDNGEQPEQMTQAELEELRQAQEQEQAMEQWLRRIPNDPGGLLRRKFRYQYQQDGRDQDGNNTWPDDQAQPW